MHATAFNCFTILISLSHLKICVYGVNWVIGVLIEVTVLGHFLVVIGLAIFVDRVL